MISGKTKEESCEFGTRDFMLGRVDKIRPSARAFSRETASAQPAAGKNGCKRTNLA
jgi:hypothetical protein